MFIHKLIAARMLVSFSIKAQNIIFISAFFSVSMILRNELLLWLRDFIKGLSAKLGDLSICPFLSIPIAIFNIPSERQTFLFHYIVSFSFSIFSYLPGFLIRASVPVTEMITNICFCFVQKNIFFTMCVCMCAREYMCMFMLKHEYFFPDLR